MSKLSGRLGKLELQQALADIEAMTDEELHAILDEDPISAQVLQSLDDDVLGRIAAGDRAATRYYEQLYKQARYAQ